ncbi:YjfK family protein [Halomonas huangheensis]|uniref:DUF2491 domain-containing protein n=1 Tax=Halomonas huangheensis TaxID=1178482 RepID=W1NDC8_9GAMM|nr:YjfK family protein [Halomonas huangheensis]ALM52850.1 hypothetical protein AR456_11585 [Halomonas huangheensis]ERL53235.1 hypothetical protein BJB45_18345 [Halomonas huangheensis]
MFERLFGKRQATTEQERAPEVMGLHLGGSFSLDELKLRLIEPEVIPEGMASHQIIQAVGEVKLDANSRVLRFYTDDDAFLQVLLDGGGSESDIRDVKLWYFYETKGVGSDADWNQLLAAGISQPKLTFEDREWQRVWEGTGDASPPVAMTETTWNAEGNTSSTDQFAMLYEREMAHQRFEYLMQVGEERLVDNRLDRCLVISTGFDIEPADLTFI